MIGYCLYCNNNPCKCPQIPPPTDSSVPQFFTKQQLEAAVLAEREACAYTCDINANGNWTSGALACAAAIRARGDK